MFDWIFGNKKVANRKVALHLKTNSVYVVDAISTQSGWMANWIGGETFHGPSEWCFLNDDGTTSGCDIVKSWRKVSGWPEEKQNDSSSN